MTCVCRCPPTCRARSTRYRLTRHIRCLASSCSSRARWKPSGLPVGAYTWHFGHRPPDEQVRVQRAIAEMRLVIERLVPNFNDRCRRRRSSPGVSDLYVLSASAQSAPLVTGEYTGPIYTGQLRPMLRTYVCTVCGTEATVGGEAGGRFATIEALKDVGCPACGSHTFRLIWRKHVESGSEPHA